MMDTQTILEKFVSARLPDWRTLLQKLIKIPSLFESEHGMIDAVASYVHSLGLEVQTIEHHPDILQRLPAAQPPISQVPGRRSLVVRIPGKGQGRSLILNSHLDVVPAEDTSGWKYPPFSGEIDKEKNVIYGRGAMDDKAGVAVCLAIIETIMKLNLQFAGDILFYFVIEDETTGNGSLLCLKAGYKADAALILDGTRADKAINQHAGVMQCAIRVKGKPVSVSVSHIGVNAAEMLSRLLLYLRDAVFALNEQRMDPWTRFPSPYQLVIHKMHSEGQQLTVPEFAKAECYLTFPPPWALSNMREFLIQKVEHFSSEHHLPSTPEFDWSGFAVEPIQTSSEEIERVLQESAAELRMPPIDIGPSTGCSDMRHFAAEGIPCLLYGPGAGFNPHRYDEYYCLDDLPRMIFLYLEVIQRWCSDRH